MNQDSKARAFSIPEVLAILAVIGVLFLVYVSTRPVGHVKPDRIKCVNNLKNVGLAFRIFATDNNDHFPSVVFVSNGVSTASLNIETIFGALSNELSTPKILYCPSDTKRKATGSFTNFTAKNVSYFVNLSADENQPETLLAGDRNILVNGANPGPRLLVRSNTPLSWSKEIHIGQGNIVMGDGSVQQMSNSRLQQALLDFGGSTNELIFP